MKAMGNRSKIIPIIIVVLLAFLLAPQLQQVANASSNSPYESGRDHGCDDAAISDVDDRYINQPEKGPSFHTNEFMRGYNAGYDDCSGSEDGNDNDNDKTYCDVPNPSNPCHDRKDYSDTTGLYTCLDGSHEANWRDCTGGGSNDDDDDSHPQNDPDCWYGGLYVCDDESGECDNDEFDCMTDCADGSIVTTGEECPGNDDSDEPASDDSWEDEQAAEEESGGYWEDDGYIDENGDGNYDEGEE